MNSARRSSPSGSSPPATAASSRCSTARTSCSHSPARSRSPTSPRPERDGARSLRPLAGRGLDHDAAGRASGSASPRSASRLLVTIGACATAGRHPGAAQLRDVDDSSRSSTPTPEYIETLATSTPIADHVTVDFELHGCPIDKRQLLEVIGACWPAAGPRSAATACASECKRRGTVCVMVAHGTPCLGPVTHAGCGAHLPGLRPRLLRLLRPDGDAEHRGAVAPDAQRSARTSATSSALFRTFNASAEPFRSGGARRMSSSTRPIRSRHPRPGSRARARCDVAIRRRPRDRGRSSTSSSRRASSKPSCAAAPSPKCRTSPRASAASARSPTR